MQISVKPNRFLLGLGKSKTVYITCKNYGDKEEKVAFGIDENSIIKDKSKKMAPRIIFIKVSSKSCVKIPIKFATKLDTKRGVYRIPILSWKIAGESESCPEDFVNKVLNREETFDKKGVLATLGEPLIFNIDITVKKRGEGSTPKTLVILGSAALAGYSYLIFKKIKGENVKIIPPWKGVN